MDRFELWTVIIALGIGSFLLRFSFIGLIGDRPLPEWLLRHLRYTAVAILPAMVAPLVVWSDGPGTQISPEQIAAGGVALLTGALTRSTLLAVLMGALAITGFILLG